MTGYIDAQVARALLGEQVAAAPALAGFLDGYADEFLRDLAGGASPGELVRGVPETLSDCAAAGISLGLSTGNAARVARAKLTATGIERWFVFDPRAGFGDLADDRRGVAAAGVAGLAVTPSPTVWLIGDTPADMLAARAIGLTAVGVLTGAADARALRDAGANAILDSAAGVAALALAAPVELRPSE
jgi:phosphoglycolate phosphatase